MQFLENSKPSIEYLSFDYISNIVVRIRFLDVKYFPICHQYYSLESGNVTDW